MKKIISLMIICSLITSVSSLELTGCAYSDETPIEWVSEKENYTLSFKLNDNNLYEVTGFATGNKDKITEIKIPLEHDGVKVAGIGKNAFKGCKELAKVTIPEGIEYIGCCAFVECPKLREITIPRSVREVGYGSLFCYITQYFDEDTGEMYNEPEIYEGGGTIYGYTGTAAEEYTKDEYEIIFVDLEEYVDENKIRYKLQENGEYTVMGLRGGDGNLVFKSEIDGHPVTAIAECAFEGYAGIYSVKIPGSVKTIGAGAFNLCYEIKEVKLGDGIENIENMAFCENLSLKDVTIPKSVKTIGEKNFGTYRNTVETEDGETMAWFCENITIKGYKDSEAERYAGLYKEITFVPIDDLKPLKKGDVDGDEKITANDSLKILRASVELDTLNDYELPAADADADNSLTSVDALIVLRASVNIDDGYEIGK